MVFIFCRLKPNIFSPLKSNLLKIRFFLNLNLPKKVLFPSFIIFKPTYICIHLAVINRKGDHAEWTGELTCTHVMSAVVEEMKKRQVGYITSFCTLRSSYGFLKYIL